MGIKTIKLLAEGIYKFRQIHNINGTTHNDMNIARHYLESLRHSDGNYTFDMFLREYFSKDCNK